MGKRRPATPLTSTPRTLHGAFPVATLDLHGLRAHQIEGRVGGFLRQWSVREPGAVVEIITGKGNRSEAGPVLFGAVRDLLEHEFADLVDDSALARGAGGWMVRLRDRR